MNNQSSAIKDEILKSYIDQIYVIYDSNNTGTLNPNQMTNFFNALFKSLEMNIVLSPQQSLEVIKAVYPNYNGTVNRDELFVAFKILLGMNNMQQMNTTMPAYNTGYATVMTPQGLMRVPQMNNYQPTFINGQNYLYNQNMMNQAQGQNYAQNMYQGFNGYNPNANTNQFNYKR